MKDKRKILVIIMSVILAMLIIIGIVIGVLQKKKQTEQGIYYQNGAESVEDWDEEAILDDETYKDEVVQNNDADSKENESTGAYTNESNVEENSSEKTSKNENVDSNNNDKKENNKKDNNSSNRDDAENKKPSTQKDENKAPVKIPSAGKLTYEEYMSMSPEKQEEYFEKFDSEEDFFNWYREAKSEYDKNNKDTVIEGGSIDIGDYMD